MLLLKNNLIRGIISKILKTVFGIIYKILSVFNLQFTLFVLILGVILYVLGVFENTVYLSVFLGVLALSVVYAILATLKKAFGFNLKDEKSKPKRTHETVEQVQMADENQESNYYREEEKEEAVTYPKYYAVKQNSNYIMAEYQDRYELYLKSSSGLKKVRVDYKK